LRPDWHQNDRADPLVRQYQLTLNAILRDHADLASCAVHCCHCGIRFLTHPRNANRRDLRCEFGCREHHRRRQAKERSKKHYRTSHGRANKKGLNGKRSVAGRGTEGERPPDRDPRGEDASSSQTSSSREQAWRSTQDPTHRAAEIAGKEARREDVKLALDGLVLDEVTLVNSPMLPYLAMVATVLEGRTIGIAELLQVLRQSMRQRSFDRLPRREYVLGFLNHHPP
jgi:hypothetical protein